MQYLAIGVLAMLAGCAVYPYGYTPPASSRVYVEPPVQQQQAPPRITINPPPVYQPPPQVYVDPTQPPAWTWPQ